MASTTTTTMSTDELRPHAQQHGEQHGDDHAPNDRWQLQERQGGEHDDAADAPEDVEPIGLERFELHEGAGHPVANARHDGDGEDEDHRQPDPSRQRIHAEGALELAGQVREVDREEGHEGDQQRQCERCERQQVGRSVDAQEPDADAEEAGQQHEVREVGEVDVVGRRPPDQRQLEEQHEEAEADETQSRP